jgi:hypothetical protein
MALEDKRYALDCALLAPRPYRPELVAERPSVTCSIFPVQ